MPDGETNQQTLREFSSRGRSSDRWNLLRMSADVAILLVDSYSDFANCGSNYFWALQSGRTLGTVSRSCIIKYVPTISFTFHVSPVLLTRLLTDLVSPTISWRHQTETQSTTTQRATLMLSWVIFLGIQFDVYFPEGGFTRSWRTVDTVKRESTTIHLLGSNIFLQG